MPLPQEDSALSPEQWDLYSDHLELAHSIAAKKAISFSGNDLMHERMRDAAENGLLSAARLFLPTKNASFRTYATIRIKGAIQDAQRQEWGWQRSVQGKLKQLRESPTEETDINSVIGALALTAHRKERLALAAQRQHRGQSVLVSLSAERDEDGRSLEDFLSDSRKNPEQECLEADKLARIEKAVDDLRLSQRDQLIIKLYFSDLPNMKDIGELFEIVESRVSQIINSAVRQLRRSPELRFLAEADDIDPTPAKRRQTKASTISHRHGTLTHLLALPKDSQTLRLAGLK